MQVNFVFSYLSLEKLDTYMEEFLSQFNSMLQADMEQDFETLVWI